jgi:hypothetical protein
MADFALYCRNEEELAQRRLAVKQMSCPVCGLVGALILHGPLRGCCGCSRWGRVRGHRRAGCGRTFSMALPEGASRASSDVAPQLGALLASLRRGEGLARAGRATHDSHRPAPAPDQNPRHLHTKSAVKQTSAHPKPTTDNSATTTTRIRFVTRSGATSRADRPAPRFESTRDLDSVQYRIVSSFSRMRGFDRDRLDSALSDRIRKLKACRERRPVSSMNGAGNGVRTRDPQLGKQCKCADIT